MSYRGMQNILYGDIIIRGRYKISRDTAARVWTSGHGTTHHHSPNLKYLATTASVSSNENCGTGTVGICQFPSTARQWIANYLCEAHSVLSLTAMMLSKDQFLICLFIPALSLKSNLCRSI